MLVSLSECAAEVVVFAPDQSFQPKDYLSGEPLAETRNVLREAARIARGQISSLSELKTEHFDAVVFPGGLGAATNLSSWAERGAACDVKPEVARVIREFHAAEKPIGAICIAPVLVAKVLGPRGVTVTVGAAGDVATEVEKTGAIHESCSVDDFITDRDHRIVTTPAYMYGDASPFAVFTGIRKAVRELVEMA